jgi:hypothetical protein
VGHLFDESINMAHVFPYKSPTVAVLLRDIKLKCIHCSSSIIEAEAELHQSTRKSLWKTGNINIRRGVRIKVPEIGIFVVIGSQLP